MENTLNSQRAGELLVGCADGSVRHVYGVVRVSCRQQRACLPAVANSPRHASATLIVDARRAVGALRNSAPTV